MGESKLKLTKREEMLMSCAGILTMAGWVQVRWETESAATPMGQLAYFIEFLNLTGLWSRWQENGPLSYTSRPWLMSPVGRRLPHAGQTTITLTGLHAHFEKAQAALERVSALLQDWVVQATEQLTPTTVWNLVCGRLKHVLAGISPPTTHRLLENHPNGMG